MGCYYLLLLEHRNQMTRHNAHITTLQYNYHFLVRTCTKGYTVFGFGEREKAGLGLPKRQEATCTRNRPID